MRWQESMPPAGLWSRIWPAMLSEDYPAYPTNRDAGLSKEVLASYQLALYNKVQGINGIRHYNKVL